MCCCLYSMLMVIRLLVMPMIVVDDIVMVLTPEVLTYCLIVVDQKAAEQVEEYPKMVEMVVKFSWIVVGQKMAQDQDVE